MNPVLSAILVLAVASLWWHRRAVLHAVSRARRAWEWRGYTPGRTFRRVDGTWRKVDR